MSASLDEVWKQSEESAKVVERASRQLTELLCQAQLLDGEVSFLKTQMSECIKKRDDATIPATEQSRQSRILDARISLSEDELESLKRKE